MQLVDQGTLEQISIQSVSLTRRQLIQLWEDGILTNTAFVYLALSVERAGDRDYELDLAEFRTNWRGYEDPNTGKFKVLGEDHLLKALADIQKRERLAIKHQQLCLEFFGD